MYVLQRHEDGRYVANPGTASSYTRALERARKFPSRAAAEADKCGNETAIDVNALLRE